MEESTERTGFSRACSYLNYKPVSKWTAYVASVLTGFLYVALLIILGLFADLMVNRGLLPSYRELGSGEKKIFLEDWKELSVVDRGQALSRDNTLASLVSINDLTEEQAALAWKPYLAHRIEKRVNVEAANEAFDHFDTRHGALGLIARSDLHGRFISSILGGFASWNPWMWQHGNRAFPPYLVGLFLTAIALLVLRVFLTIIMHEASARTTIEAANRLRRAVYHHTFRLGTLAFRALGPSEAVTIFTRHVEAVHDALHTQLTVRLREPVKFVLLILLALFIHIWLALAIILFAFLVWMIGGQIAAHFRRQGRLANNEAGERLTLIRESLMMMRLVKVYMMELFNQSRVERQLAGLSQAQKERFRGETIYRPILILLGTLAAVCLLFVAGLILLHGSFSVASAIMMVTALISLYWPLARWLETNKTMRRGRDAARNLFKFLDKPGDVGQVVGAEFLPDVSERIDFDNVSLKEPGAKKMLLEKVSLTIKSGQRIGLVGAEDSEKHAFAYLLPRLLDPTQGEIRIDDHNLRWVTLDSLRDKIGMVLTHNLVFHDTIANNIGCGDKTYTLPKIIEAAKIARAHKFISKLPKGYETPIGELGHHLKASEKYRIALARVIVRDPSIVVIEEPEQAFDDETKHLIDDTFARFLPGRTVIFLPHRITTIKSCDRLYVLHNGRIEAAGTHKELLTANKLYRHLHYIEFNEMAESV